MGQTHQRFSPATRQILGQLARAIMPPGRRFQPPGEQTVDRLEALFHGRPPGVRQSYEASVHLLDRMAILSRVDLGSR